MLKDVKLDKVRNTQGTKQHHVTVAYLKAFTNESQCLVMYNHIARDRAQYVKPENVCKSKGFYDLHDMQVTGAQIGCIDELLTQYERDEYHPRLGQLRSDIDTLLLTKPNTYRFKYRRRKAWAKIICMQMMRTERFRRKRMDIHQTHAHHLIKNDLGAHVTFNLTKRDGAFLHAQVLLGDTRTSDKIIKTWTADYQFNLLINHTDRALMTSDHPVAMFRFVGTGPSGGCCLGTGAIEPLTTVFFPITPKSALVLSPPVIANMAQFKPHQVIHMQDSGGIDFLNQWTVLNAHRLSFAPVDEYGSLMALAWRAYPEIGYANDPRRRVTIDGQSYHPDELVGEDAQLSLTDKRFVDETFLQRVFNM